ncbi:hypothetical protein [Kaarinaea lacus]
MRELAHSWFGKILLCCIGAIIAISLVASSTCHGPIDAIFVGWRDQTGCDFGSTCLVGGNENHSAAGAGVLLLFLIFMALSYGCARYFHKLKANLSFMGEHHL